MGVVFNYAGLRNSIISSPHFDNIQTIKNHRLQSLPRFKELLSTSDKREHDQPHFEKPEEITNRIKSKIIPPKQAEFDSKKSEGFYQSIKNRSLESKQTSQQM